MSDMQNDTVHVYYAGIYGQRTYINELAKFGPKWVNPTSRWHSVDQGDDDRSPRDWALIDLQDVESADAVIVFPHQIGWGHALEIGWAWGNGIPVYAVLQMPGQPEFDNVFTHLEGPLFQKFNTLSAAYNAIDRSLRGQKTEEKRWEVLRNNDIGGWKLTYNKTTVADMITYRADGMRIAAMMNAEGAKPAFILKRGDHEEREAEGGHHDPETSDLDTHTSKQQSQKGTNNELL